MIEDDFYATIKFKSGEEIFAKVAASEEIDRTILLVSNPIIVNEVQSKKGIMGYRIEPWLKTTKEDMFMIDLKEVLTMSESSDVEMITMYQRWLRDTSKIKSDEPKLSREMGYIANVNDAKDILEKLYKLKESKG
jgi:hypothetical protein|tara:strand:+ start:610 stop:1014 length:405 start_codon:yes stop_codon:yes gene_type:complete